MSDFVPITEGVLARARRDPKFRQQLCTYSLDQLLAELNRLQKANAQADPKQARQIREGAKLAAELADLIRELDEQQNATA